MAGTSPLFWISLVLSIIGLNANGELSILYSPPSLSFTGSSKVPESSLKEIFSAVLGLSVEENSNWNGLRINDPFDTPECVVEVYIDGVSKLGNTGNLKSQNFPLIVDVYEPETYEEVKHRILQRYNNGGNKMVNVGLRGSSEKTTMFGDLNAKPKKQTYKHLKSNVEEDAQFLTELESLKTLIAKVNSGVVSADNVVDLYYIRVYSIHALSDFHGPNSLQVKEAKKLMGETLEALTAAFVKAYDGSVLVTAVTTDIVHTRKVSRVPRDIRSNDGPLDGGDDNIPADDPDPPQPADPPSPADPSDPPPDPPPPADVDPDPPQRPPKTDPFAGSSSDPTGDGYSADYAAIFNIILWFGIVFAFSLVAIVYALVDMDPGRDSIIYRMTNTRMKKDN